MSTEPDVIVERPLSSFEGMRVSWGGIWAGVLVVLGSMLVSMVWDRPTALAAAPGAVAWITFIAVVLSLLATLGGAALGRRRAAAHITHKVE